MLQIKRTHLKKRIEQTIDCSPITVLLGPRQCGKTTISQTISYHSKSEFFDLENPEDTARLSFPMLTLKPLKGLIIIDEIQRMPELFNILRVLADRKNSEAKFLVLGSASTDIVKGVSESLAGRASFIDMSGFTLEETGNSNLLKLWDRGGFPRSYTAKDSNESLSWRNDFIRTFLERDIPQLGIHIPSTALRKFWTMLAHYHGQIWNAAEFAKSMGTSEPTIKKYLDILTGAYVIRQIQPWFENLKKRQVKSPKIFIRDSGILHALLSLPEGNILRHPKLGASWEGFIIEQLLNKYETRDYYFWATHTGAELDLLIFHNSQKIGFEIKYADAPKTTKSMHSALESLNLDKLFVIYPGSKRYLIDEKIEVLPSEKIQTLEG